MIPTLVREIGRDIGIGLLVIDHGFRRIVEWEQDLKNAQTLFGRRKEDKIMGNVFADLQLAITAANDLKAALPLLGQAAADLKQAYADKADPTKAGADLEAALGVVGPLLTTLAGMLPPPNVPATPAA